MMLRSEIFLHLKTIEDPLEKFGEKNESDINFVQIIFQSVN